MAARSQPVGLRGCRETMSAAGRQKTNITPPATSGGKGRRSSEVGRGTAAFLARSSQLRAASASEVPPIPQASQTAPRRRIVHLVLRALFRVASVPHERPGFVTKNVTGNESGLVQHPGTSQRLCTTNGCVWVGTLVRVRGGAAALSPPHTAPNGPGQKPASASASRLSDGSTVRPDADYFVYCALAVVGKVEIGDPDAGPEQRSTAHYSRGLHPPWGGLPVSTVTLARASPG